MQIRFALTLATAVAACWMAGAAGADELSGEDFLRGKNTDQQAVLLGTRVYQLDSQTRILGLDGEELTLGDLIWVPELESLDQVPRVPTLWVRYEAHRLGDRLVLNWVQLSLAQEGLDLTKMSDVDRYGRLPRSDER